MIVNGKKYDMKTLVNSISSDNNFLKKCGNIYLSDKEMKILDYYKIDYLSALSYDDLRIRIENYIDCDLEDGDTDLDWVLDQIAERDYYYDTNK